MGERKTIDSAASRSVDALEKMGGAVESGVEKLTKEVKHAASATVSAASGMAKHAYPELVRRQATEGLMNLIGGMAAGVLALCLTVVAFFLLGYGLDFTGEDTAGVTRAVFFCIDIIAVLISFSIASSLVAIGVLDIRAPEGPVIDTLLKRFLSK